MNKTILVPTDFSENAENALQYAVAFARKQNAGITLIHANYVTYAVPDSPVQFSSVTSESTEDYANRRLKAICESLKLKENIECGFISKTGDVVDAILQGIIETQPDMVIMGTKGASGLKELIFGSHTAKVIEKANCPVMAIPSGATFRSVDHIMYAANYHASDVDALARIVEMARLFNAGVSVIHLVNDQNALPEAEERMLNFRAAVVSKVQCDKMEFKLIFSKDVEGGIEEYIRRESPDLLSMSTHYRDVFDKLFGSSLTKTVAYHTGIPLLAFHYIQEPVIFI